MSEYEIGLGLQLVPEFTTYFEDRDLSVRLTAELHEGRYICTEVNASPTSGGPPGVTLERLRDIRLAAMIEQVARVPGCEQVLSTTGRTLIAEADGPTDDVLEVVAATYRYGHALGEAPTREVMDLLGLPRSKAARWIARARTKGFLESTQARIPGGAVVEELRSQQDLNALQRQQSLLENRVTEIEREIDKYRKAQRETVGGKHYTRWLEDRISDLEREIDKHREQLDVLSLAVQELEGAGDRNE